MNKMLMIRECGECPRTNCKYGESGLGGSLMLYCGELEGKSSKIHDKTKILPNCPLENETYDLGPDLEKAALLMQRLIKSNAREGWEDSEHYNTVLDDANDFLANFEEIDTSEEIELELSLCPIPFCKEPRGKEDDGSYICPCPHCGDTIPF